MENIIKKNKKKIRFSKSVNNLECIGPCYPAFKIITHPITGDSVTKHNPFCPVVPREVKTKSGKIEIDPIDECRVPTDESMINDEYVLIPNMEFTREEFLKRYYEIYSMEDAVTWCENNKSSPYLTIKRVIDCAWSVYGRNDDLIDDRVIDYFMYIIRKKWISDIYGKFRKYICVDEKKQIFICGKYNNNNTEDEYKVEKINFLITKFVSPGIVMEILNKLKSIDDIDPVTNHLKNELINLIETKINKILQ